LIAMATGGAWVFYFADAPTLAGQLIAFQAPAIAYGTIAILTLTTYVFGGLMREQVCTYMCPWPRIMGAMLDEESLVVTYHNWRGEPRGKHLKLQDTAKAGDCVDCGACVVVCPMGIDIRDGQQLECITCALCIDACNGVMEKLGRPANLIGYDTLSNDRRRAEGKPTHYRLWRPRTILYAALWSLLGLFMVYALVTRADLDISALHDRSPLFVRLTEGGLRNGYTIRILNKQHAERHIVLSVEDLPGAQLSIVGQDGSVIDVPADDVRSLKAYVSLPAGAVKTASTNFSFAVSDKEGGASARYETVFRGPE
jgi:cytochrome c oxidase accessory protein FixG